MYVLIVDGRYHTNTNLLWSNDILQAAIFDIDTATQIQQNWIKFNTVLTGVNCKHVKVHLLAQ